MAAEKQTLEELWAHMFSELRMDVAITYDGRTGIDAQFRLEYVHKLPYATAPVGAFALLCVAGQPVAERLQRAFKKLISDPKLLSMLLSNMRPDGAESDAFDVEIHKGPDDGDEDDGGASGGGGPVLN
jgi:hypothetical protein